MLLMGGLFLLIRSLFPRKVQKDVKELILMIAISLQHGEGNVHVESPYFHIMIEKVWS